ncbi:MAG: enoyl-CoA hydratase-related protein [Candidatus Thorarchaeota archaeon]
MVDDKKFEHIKLEKIKEGDYAVISITRPEKLNALHDQTLREISEALEVIEVDRDVRCVVLRGDKEFTKKPVFLLVLTSQIHQAVILIKTI